MGWLSLNSGLLGLLNLSVLGWLLVGILILTLIQNRNKIREFFIFQMKIRKLAAQLPTYPGLPLFGNALQFLDSDKTIFTFTRMSREINAGTFTVWLGPIMKVIVTDPRDYEIIIGSPKAMEKDDVYKFMEPAVVNSLINGGGQVYRAHKKLLVPLINGGNCITEHIKQFNIQTKRMVNAMEKYAGGEVFDIHDVIVPCVSDIVFETMFGISGQAQNGEWNVLMGATEPLLHHIYKRIANVWLWPDIIFNNTTPGKLNLKTVVDVHKFLDTVVEKKTAEWNKERSQKNIDDNDLSGRPVLEHILTHNMKTNSWSQLDFRSELYTLFIGSADTIAGLSCFAALMLAMHPEIQKKAREEVLREVGHRDMTEEDTNNLKLMDAIVREVIRLFPVGPLLARKMTGDLKLATCTLPKGASVYLVPFATHRDPKYWDEPEKFMPERFFPENSKDRPTWAYVPFSGGLRSCPGSKYGMISIKSMISQIIRNYELSTTLKYETLQIHAHISTRSADGYPVTIKKINH